MQRPGTEARSRWPSARRSAFTLGLLRRLEVESGARVWVRFILRMRESLKINPHSLGAEDSEAAAMVFESILVELLNRVLGPYVKNLDASQLRVGVWGGEL